jgi:hypothetical protein
MIYDDQKKKWCPSGSSHGLSKVHIYHHFLNSTFRVVGRKLEDHEVRRSLLFGMAIMALVKRWMSKLDILQLRFGPRNKCT